MPLYLLELWFLTTVFHEEACGAELYRGNSCTKKRAPLDPYRRPMPRFLEGSEGVGLFL